MRNDVVRSEVRLSDCLTVTFTTLKHCSTTLIECDDSFSYSSKEVGEIGNGKTIKPS